MRYTHAGDQPILVFGVRHGIDGTVERANPDAAEAPDGSTVLLSPGDVLTTHVPLQLYGLVPDGEPEPAAASSTSRRRRKTPPAGKAAATKE